MRTFASINYRQTLQMILGTVTIIWQDVTSIRQNGRVQNWHRHDKQAVAKNSSVPHHFLTIKKKLLVLSFFVPLSILFQLEFRLCRLELFPYLKKYQRAQKNKQTFTHVYRDKGFSGDV